MSGLFGRHEVLQGCVVEHRLSQQALQLGVLVLKHLQALGIGDVHAAELCLPAVECGGWCCQSNANPSPLFAGQQVLHNEKFAPFAKGGVSQRFKSGPPLDVSLVIEMIVYRRMH